MSLYIRQTLLITLLICSLIAAVNWLVNPYLMFNSPVIHGINEWVTENYYKQLLFKPYQLHNQQLRSIIIGASQSGIAFNPEKLPQPAYNLAVGGSTSYIQHRLLQDALATNTPDTVILETPFFAFNSSDPNNQPEKDQAFENRLVITTDGSKNLLQPAYEIQEKLSSLISWDITRATFRTLIKQRDITDKKRGSFIQLRNGQWIQQQPPGIDTKKIIENSWRKSIFNDWLPAPEHVYTLSDSNNSAMAYYRKSLQLLYMRNIHSTIVMAPLHASLLIALQEIGLWPQFQQWKHMLVTINEEEAHKAGKSAFPIYDYAIINSYTSEALPASESNVRLTWFNDSMHASPLFGDLILQEILSGTPENGKKLYGINMDNELTGDTFAVAHYIGLHPEQQAAIRTLLLNHQPQQR